MKICILTPRYPFPENGGDVLRINHIASYLRNKGNEVILISNVSKSEKPIENEIYHKTYVAKRTDLLSCINSFLFFLFGKPLQYGYYYSHRYLKLLRSVIEREKPDLFISHTHRMIRYIEKCNLKENTIVEMSDALSKTYALSSANSYKNWKSFLYKIEKKRIVQYEKYIIQNFRKIVLVSESDKKYLGNQPNIFVYPNGNAIKMNECHEYDDKKIVFVGNMRTLQNQDAVIYFVNDILPLIKQRIPNVKFYVIGAQPSKKILELSKDESIFVTGFVDDIGRYICDACLSVAPIRIAAGLQNKILESMSYCVPVVLSKTIMAGIPELESNQNCIISETTEEYAEACLKLMLDPALRNDMAKKGYEMVKESYNWDKKLCGYENFN